MITTDDESAIPASTSFRERFPLIRAVFLTLAFAAATTSASEAQVCAAAPSFHRFPLRVDGAAAVGDSVEFFGGGLTVGSSGAFGSAAAGATQSDELRDWALTVSVGGGYQLPLDTRSRFQICPMVDFSFVFGPDSLYGSDVSYRETGLAFGISVGGKLVKLRPFSVTASASLMAVRASRRFEDGFGNSEVLRGTSGVLGLAVGVIVVDALTLRLSVSVPFRRGHSPAPIGVKGSSTRFAITVGIGFGPALAGTP